MSNKSKQTALSWQRAVDFFEKNFHLGSQDLHQNVDFQALEKTTQQKVAKLFQNKKQKNTILDQPTIHVFNSLLNQDLSGQTVDSYTLIKLIEHGGMSSVYRARKNDIETQKDVAIKLIPANLQTAETIALFKQELKTLSKLYHPNIISMHHGDVSQSGTPYLVMELVEDALQIDQYFIQNTSNLTTIISQFIVLCNVINYAHQNNVIHQDIKPSNVLLDQHGHLLVLDFGVSTLAEAIPDHHGYTLSYAAPEQASQEQLPQASFDTYAITSLLVKCLSQYPDDQPGWQHRAINQLKVDHDLLMILSKGINQKNTSRYQLVDELAMDLHLWQKKLPINHLKNNIFYRLKKTISRHPSSFALASLALVSMITGLIFYQQQYQIALSESTKALQIKNILIKAIDQNDPDISKGTALTVRDMLKQVELSHAESKITDPNLAKELFLTLAQAFNKLGDYESTAVNIQNILKLEPNHTEALLELAELNIAQKQLKEVQNLLTRLKPFTPFPEIESTIRYHLIKAQAHVIDNDFMLAEKQFYQAQILSNKTDAPEFKVRVLAAYANGFLEQDKMDEAINKITEAVDLSGSTLGNEHSLTLAMKALLAETFLSVSGEKVEQAIDIFKEIIPQQRALLGNNHPIVAKSLFLNATALRSLNKIEAARHSAEEALNISEQQFGNNHIFTGKIMMNLGGIYLAEGNVERATKYANKAVKNHEAHFGTKHPETLQYKTSYVAMLVKNNQHEDALEILLQILPIQTAELGINHRATLYVQIVLSKTYVALGDLQKGVDVGEQCLTNAKQSEVKNIMEVYCALTLENAYFLNKQYDAASGLIKQYHDDPLITSQPQANNQFEEHQKFINQITINQP